MNQHQHNQYQFYKFQFEHENFQVQLQIEYNNFLSQIGQVLQLQLFQNQVHNLIDKSQDKIEQQVQHITVQQNSIQRASVNKRREKFKLFKENEMKKQNKTRVSYTINQKNILLKLMQQKNMNNRWRKFSSLMKISVNTLKYWTRKKERKIKKSCKYYNITFLEQVLYDRILDFSSTRRITRQVIEKEAIMICKALIKDYIKKTTLGKEVSSKLITEKMSEINFPSRYWLRKFNKKYNLVYEKQVGDSANVDLSLHVNRIGELQQTVKQHDLRDVFNFDETCLYYNNIGNYFYSVDGKYAGKKTSKQHITLALCSNCYGDYLLPIIIGKNSPKKVSNEYDYYSNKKAWMTTDIFQKL